MTQFSINPTLETEHLNIIIADDHALVRGGFALLVGMIGQNVNVIEANNFDNILEILTQNSNIDLILLDLMMPGTDGFEGLERLGSERPEVPVVIVSVKEDFATIKKALALGAMGYIPKTSAPNVTTGAIKLVLSGGIYLPPNMLQTEDDTTDSGRNTGSRSTHFGLTNRQLEVIKLISIGKSNKSIAQDLGLTAGTIKMHTTRIFKVLNVQNRTEAASKFNQLQKQDYN